MDTHGTTHPLNVFRENAAELVAQLQQTGQSLTLTIDGQAAAVVQDVDSYRRLRHLAAQTSVEEGLRLGLEDVEAGRVTPVREAFDSLRAEFGIPR